MPLKERKKPSSYPAGNETDRKGTLAGTSFPLGYEPTYPTYLSRKNRHSFPRGNEMPEKRWWRAPSFPVGNGKLYPQRFTELSRECHEDNK